jgi:hypothetical protein
MNPINELKLYNQIVDKLIHGIPVCLVVDKMNAYDRDHIYNHFRNLTQFGANLVVFNLNEFLKLGGYKCIPNTHFFFDFDGSEGLLHSTILLMLDRSEYTKRVSNNDIPSASVIVKEMIDVIRAEIIEKIESSKSDKVNVAQYTFLMYDVHDTEFVRRTEKLKMEFTQNGFFIDVRRQKPIMNKFTWTISW